MSANPSTKWFWNDWDNDRGLSLCSLAAQGLWMRMLSIAARGGGYVAVDGQKCTTEDIATLTGKSLDEIIPLLAELRERRVFSMSRRGVIFNRRMIRDSRRRETNRDNGKLGGLASVRKQRGIFQSPKRNAERPSSDALSATPSPLYPIPLTPYSPPVQNGADAPSFLQWYSGYPHKVGKRRAEVAYRAALARASPDELAAGRDRYIATKPAKIAWCNPATWLNQDRWLDQPRHVGTGNGASKPAEPLTQTRWDAMNDAERSEYLPGYERPL